MKHQKSQACEAGNTEKTKARRGNDPRNRKTSVAEAWGGRARKVERGRQDSSCRALEATVKGLDFYPQCNGINASHSHIPQFLFQTFSYKTNVSHDEIYCVLNNNDVLGPEPDDLHILSY